MTSTAQDRGRVAGAAPNRGFPALCTFIRGGAAPARNHSGHGAGSAGEALGILEWFLVPPPGFEPGVGSPPVVLSMGRWMVREVLASAVLFGPSTQQRCRRLKGEVTILSRYRRLDHWCGWTQVARVGCQVAGRKLPRLREGSQLSSKFGFRDSGQVAGSLHRHSAMF